MIYVGIVAAVVGHDPEAASPQHDVEAVWYFVRETTEFASFEIEFGLVV